MTTLPDAVRRVIDGPNYAHVATVGSDGHPQNTVMWIAREGDRVLLNTAVGRVKWRNVRRDPRVSISISPLDDPYVNFSLSGRVVDVRTCDGDEVIDRLAQKYLGVARYPYRRPGEVRVTLEVKVTGIAGNR